MLSKAIAYLESKSTEVLYVRQMDREGRKVYKIEAKTTKGKTELFQLRGLSHWHHKVTLGKGIEENLIFTFSEQ